MAVEWGIEVVLAIALYGLDGPASVLTTAPGEVLQRGDGSVLRPVHHVGGGPQQPVVHEEASGTLLVQVGDILWRGIVRRVEEQGVAHNERRGVGRVLRLEEWHVHLFQTSHLPPVEVEEFGTLAPGEHEVEVGGRWKVDGGR